MPPAGSACMARGMAMGMERGMECGPMGRWKGEGVMPGTPGGAMGKGTALPRRRPALKLSGSLGEGEGVR